MTLPPFDGSNGARRARTGMRDEMIGG
ncbi:hypothetical protein M218_29395 [Burkholderia pseudomallei MSHR338]|nr:hypothetical protein M218_29395 [Burkholderia pseudomallei MSHR338]